VIDWRYTGNRLHPTEKPVTPLLPLIEAFCPAGGIVLDPFCGSGSTLAAARQCGRRFIGIEIDGAHHETSSRRMFASIAA
jgi:site-specific DNA-methyltransferase (adenine-specific)